MGWYPGKLSGTSLKPATGVDVTVQGKAGASFPTRMPVPHHSPNACVCACHFPAAGATSLPKGLPTLSCIPPVLKPNPPHNGK